MRTNQLYIALFTLLALFTDTAVAENMPRELPPFSEVSLQISATVFLEQGDRQSVRIEAKELTGEDIITEVKGRKLTIRFKGSNYFRRSFSQGKVEIYITVPNIDALSVGGSGSIVSSSVNSPAIDLAVSGSGDISIGHLVSDKVKASLSGSGNIRLDGGRTNELIASISGSGNLKAVEFEAANADTRISGSGNCALTARNSLKARVSGSGSISYRGNPLIDSAVSGSGRIKKL